MSFEWSPLLLNQSAGAKRRLKLDEWANLDEDVTGELVLGFHVEEEMPSALHELAVSWLIFTLRTWLRDGFILASEVKLALAEGLGRKPDVAVYLPGSPAPPRHGMLRVPPDIIVEVVSPSPRDERRDRVEKMAEYAKWGVRFYWLVDPALGSFEVFSLDANHHYTQAVALTAGVASEIPGCPGLSLDLDALWTELQRLGPEEDR